MRFAAKLKQGEVVIVIALAIAVGAAIGVGGFTFGYARGLSYLSTDPAACVNCHIMQPQFDSWARASHRKAAVCVDCHLPETLIAKYATKLENGWRHGKLFTTQKFVEPIRAQPAALAVLQANCVRCHDALVHELGPGSSLVEGDGVRCVHCHAGAGHGERTGLGGPLQAETQLLLEPRSDHPSAQRRTP
jgi:cytochrome c nitrite reductase small subunit